MPRKTAVVTGASRGIGRAIALRLAKDGYDVGINDVHPEQESLHLLAHEIEEAGVRSHVLIADVSSDQEVEAMVESMVKEFGRLDVMIANAGIGPIKPLIETTAEEWDHAFAVNARGVFSCYKYSAKVMITQGTGGRIIGASSSAGKRGEAGISAYSATKFAVRGLTHSAAMELGKYGITVNAYAPGAIDTPMMRSGLGANPNLLEMQAAMSPMNRLGTPEEVAGLVSYLVSDEAAFVTGQTILIAGGRNL